jgi:hypothetical protein
LEASERKAIHDHLVAIEKEMKRRGSRGLARYLAAILIGVAATLAWQSYGDATKRMIATKAPELSWSPEAKQMIASWTLGWTKPPAGSEKQAALVATSRGHRLKPRRRKHDSVTAITERMTTPLRRSRYAPTSRIFLRRRAEWRSPKRWRRSGLTA